MCDLHGSVRFVFQVLLLSYVRTESLLAFEGGDIARGASKSTNSYIIVSCCSALGPHVHGEKVRRPDDGIHSSWMYQIFRRSSGPGVGQGIFKGRHKVRLSPSVEVSYILLHGSRVP